MVTADWGPIINNTAEFTFKGLSTDQKPVGNFNGVEIKNGSCFFEINTQDVKFYNAAAETLV